MNAQDVLDAIGNIDDECIRNAKPKKKSHKNLFITVASMAACLAFMIWVPKMFKAEFLRMEESMETAKSSAAFHSSAYYTSEAVITEGDVHIYYVDGDKVSMEIVNMSYDAEDIFAVWRKKNGIGEEVKLISREIEHNGYETPSEFQGMELIIYTMPDYFILRVTVSKNIEEYYDTIDSELLLKSLEETMRLHHQNIEYDEYYISFE